MWECQKMRAGTGKENQRRAWKAPHRGGKDGASREHLLRGRSRGARTEKGLTAQCPPRPWPCTQPYCQPGLGAEPQGGRGRLGKFHGQSSGFSMKQKHYNLVRKAKVLPKENTGQKALFSSCSREQKQTSSSFDEIRQQVPAHRYLLNTAAFSATIPCIYCHTVKNKIPADPNPSN